MTEFKEQQLLFCIKKTDSICLLYFVDFDTLQSEEPLLFCCQIRRRWVDNFVPGGLYQLEIRSGHLIQYIKEREFLISQPYYQMLLECRQMLFDGDDRPLRPQEYYTFDDYRAIMLYQPTFGQRIGVTICRAVLIALLMLLPVALFLWFSFSIFRWNTGPSIAAPFLVIGALPLTLWGIGALSVLAAQLLLRWRFTRYCILREYTLQNGGKRHRIGIPARNRKRLLVWGGLSVGIFLLSLLTLLLK